MITSYLDTWHSQADVPSELETLVRAFVEPLYSLLLDHRELALALIAAGDAPRGSESDREPFRALSSLVDRMTPQLEIEAARRALRVDSAATVVVTIGMIMGVALLQEALEGADNPALSSDRLLQEMVTYTMHGVSPVDASPAGGKKARPVRDASSPHDVAAVILQRLLETERRASRAELELEQLRRKS